VLVIIHQRRLSDGEGSQTSRFKRGRQRCRRYQGNARR
jgi:hypothetical protein